MSPVWSPWSLEWPECPVKDTSELYFEKLKNLGGLEKKCVYSVVRKIKYVCLCVCVRVCEHAHVRSRLLYMMALHSCTTDKEIIGGNSEMDPLM